MAPSPIFTLSARAQRQLLVAVVFLDLIAVSLVVPLLPARFKELGVSTKTYGLISSTYSLAQIAGGLVLGGAAVTAYGVGVGRSSSSRSIVSSSHRLIVSIRMEAARHRLAARAIEERARGGGRRHCRPLVVRAAARPPQDHRRPTRERAFVVSFEPIVPSQDRRRPTRERALVVRSRRSSHRAPLPLPPSMVLSLSRLSPPLRRSRSRALADRYLGRRGLLLLNYVGAGLAYAIVGGLVPPGTTPTLRMCSTTWRLLLSAVSLDPFDRRRARAARRDDTAHACSTTITTWRLLLRVVSFAPVDPQP